MIHLRIVAPPPSSEQALGPLCGSDSVRTAVWLERVPRDSERDDPSRAAAGLEVGRLRYSSRVGA